jgi:hypothetical protein
MKLVWKLLKQNMSIPQFVGFFFASLFGMFIVLFGYQFYRDVLPFFQDKDSFMKSDYLVISKRIDTNTSFSGRTNNFSSSEINHLSQQPFIQKVGSFHSANYQSEVSMDVQGNRLFDSEFFFESIPDAFVNVPLSEWKYDGKDDIVPIIFPKSYLAMYNFGYARNHSLPKISEGLVGMLDVQIHIRGNGQEQTLKGKVIGFSSQLSTILVPESFMVWSNQRFSSTPQNEPNRLIVDVANPTDTQFSQYLEKKGYEVENSNSSAEKMAYFFRLIVVIVMMIGLIISVLSFYILMLSIYLLVQKNTSKLQNLMLIGYSPSQVAQPYQLLTLSLHGLVFVLAIGILAIVRPLYMDVLYNLLPSLDNGGLGPTSLLGVVLLLGVTAINSWIIRNKMASIWKSNTIH